MLINVTCQLDHKLPSQKHVAKNLKIPQFVLRTQTLGK